MVWPRVKEGRGGYRQYDVKHASTGKRRRGGPIRYHYSLDTIRDDMEEYEMTQHFAPNRSVWYMKTNARPLLHGLGL